MVRSSEPPSESATETDPRPSGGSGGDRRFETVDWSSIGDGTRLAWLRPLVAALPLALVIAVGVHTIRRELDVVTVAGREVGALNAMYGLSLLFVAIVAVPRIASRPERTRRFLGRLRDRPLVAVSGFLFAGLAVVGSIYPSVAPEPEVEPLLSFQPTAWGSIPVAYVAECHGAVVDGRCQGTLAYPLGTNPAGSDMLTVGLYGLNTSLQVAVTATILAVTAGVLVGAVAGYAGGRTDELLMRYVDLQRSIPAFFVYVLLILLFHRSYQLLILTFGLLSWGGIARIVRGEVLQLRATPFVEAAKLSGATAAAVVVRHVLPNASNTVVTAAGVLFAKFVVYEAALAFLTLTDSSVVSLGNEIARAVGSESATAGVMVGAGGPPWDWGMVPWIAGVPAGVLCALLLVAGVLGDGLRDVADPRP